MDQLDIDSTAALRRGVSYGIYIANYKSKTSPVRQSVLQETVSGKQKRCAICGNIIPEKDSRRKYCCAECADKAVNMQRSEADRRRRERKKAEGTEF